VVNPQIPVLREGRKGERERASREGGSRREGRK